MQRGTIGFVEGFLGGVATDEPRAALIGRDVLSAGGSAADAATAMYFALAVTLPSSASLGGGGVCLTYDAASGVTETLDFLARPPSAVSSAATRPVAVPGNPRGFFALHSKFGRLRWAQLVAAGENLARFGTPVSRAFAYDLAAVGDALLAEPSARAVFGRADGRGVLRESDVITQIELAAVMSRLRREGPGDLYSGSLSKDFVDGVRAAGGSLTLEDLRAYRPVWRGTLKVELGNLTAHFPEPPAAAGAVAAEMFAMLIEDDRFEDGDAAERLHLLAETAMRAFADRGQWLRPDGSIALSPEQLVDEDRVERLMSGYSEQRHTPADTLDPRPVERLENTAATSFVAIDPEGSAVACALTMNGLFGTGRMAGRTGILLAAMPGPGGRGPTSLGPMVVVNENVSEFFFAAASSGGTVAPTAMMNVAARALLAEEDLEAAMVSPRVHHEGQPDIAFHEPGVSDDLLRALAARGHRLAPTPALGRVNAIHCADGLPVRPQSCSAWADRAPRGYGLAVSAD